MYTLVIVPLVCVSNEILRCLSCYSWPPHVYPCPHKTPPLRHSKNTKLSAPFKHVLKKFLFLIFLFKSITFNIFIKSPHSIIPKTQRYPSHFDVLESLYLYVWLVIKTTFNRIILLFWHFCVNILEYVCHRSPLHILGTPDPWSGAPHRGFSQLAL